MAFKHDKVLKLGQFFGNFLTLRENYRANSQIVFNRETQFWESSVHEQPEPAFRWNKVWILESLMTRFLELLIVFF